MEQREIMEVEDPAIFEALNNPLRMRVVRQLTEPKPIREVAEALDVPPTRLYYHVNLLEETGIIGVVETRKVGAMLQKVYQTTAKSFRPSRKLAESGLEPEELARITAGVVIDGARVDAVEALARMFAAGADAIDEDKFHGSLLRRLSFFTREEATEFARKLEKFCEDELDADRPSSGRREYGLTIVFMPVAGSEATSEQ